MLFNTSLKQTSMLPASKLFARCCSNLKAKWEVPSGYNTDIKIYNCIVKDKVPLILRNKNYATWYSCGPTVYDSSHIGHAACYVKQDILRRILNNYFKINLVTVMNITDIDDKIVKKSVALNTNYMEVAQKYELEFWKDMCSLNVKRPNIIARVTDFLPAIMSFVENLIDNGYAYSTEDGSVYFDLSKYKSYGKLQPQSVNLAEKSDDGLKKRKSDFALWKSAKLGEPHWKSNWGNGRPGWHVECSTIASCLLGSVIDFHCGGNDLKFPHHENEIAQSCAYHRNEQWVNYWIHIGQLQLSDDVKMSKSLGNTIKIDELLENYTSDEFRLACLTTHYRGHIDYSDDLMKHSKALHKKFYSFLTTCEAFTKKSVAFEKFDRYVIEKLLDDAAVEIDIALKDDFNTVVVINVLLDLVNKCNRLFKIKNDLVVHEFENTDIVTALSNFIVSNLEMLGVSVVPTKKDTENFDVIVQILDILTEFRKDVRNIAHKERMHSLFTLCDQLRDSLNGVGIEIKDHGKLSSWNAKKK